MTGDEIRRQIDEVRALLSERLRARGPTLARQVARAGRRLPRRLRAQARYLAEAEPILANPKLARMIDPGRAAAAHAALVAHLSALDPREAVKTRTLRILAVIALNFLLIAALIMVWLVWTGRV